jgi:glutathione S-transferase
VFPEAEHVKAIIPQCEGLYRKSAAVLEAHLGEHDWLVDDRFTVTDVIVGYTLDFGDEFGWIDDDSALLRYLKRLRTRPHCTLQARDAR